MFIEENINKKVEITTPNILLYLLQPFLNHK